ncbi:hypothetical protein [Pontibacter sp. HJ8]
MQHKIHFLLLLLAALLLPLSGKAQEAVRYKNAFTMKFFGLSVHLRETQCPDIFRNRPDTKGYLVFNYGGIAGYDRFVVRDVISVRVEQGCMLTAPRCWPDSLISGYAGRSSGQAGIR